VEAPAEARVLLGLWTSHRGASGAKWFAASLQDLSTRPFEYQWDEAGGKVVLRRRADDLLRVEVEHRSLVFRPGETFRFQLHPDLPANETEPKIRLELRLVAAPGGKEEWRQELELAPGTESLPFSLRLPSREGVYDLWITAAATGKIPLPQLKPLPGLPSLPQIAPLTEMPWSKTVLASRKVQLVVLEETIPPSRNSGEWRLLAHLEPGSNRWRERLSGLPSPSRLLPLSKASTAQGRSQIVQEGGATWVELPPSDPSGLPGWEAYTLPIEKPGGPYLLEIDYPANWPQILGVAIIDFPANSEGASTTIGTGLYVPELPVAFARSTGIRSHRLIFWTRSKNPTVFITNFSTNRPARFGKLQVSMAQGSLPLPADTSAPPEGRLVCAYLLRPFFAEHFGPSLSAAADNAAPADDWVSFYESASRLVDYVRYAGYNGLAMAIYADGSGLYPSTWLQPSLRYDTGTLSETGEDPIRKDVAELLFRLCDRAGVAFIPAIELAAPVPELERLLREDPAAAEGILLEGHLAGSGKLSGSSLLPRYNPLHPKVQELIVRVVEELLDRYGAHPSFRGVALQLTPETFTHFPGGTVPADPATLLRFYQATGLSPDPAADPAMAFRHRDRFLNWRAAQLTDFYSQLGNRVASAKPGAALYLMGPEIFQTSELRHFLRPRLPQQATLAEAYLLLGFDVKRLGQQSHVVLPRPQISFLLPHEASPCRSHDLAHLPDYSTLYDQWACRSALFFRRPDPLPAFLHEVPPKLPITSAHILCQLVPTEEEDRHRFAVSLAALDPMIVFDAGWFLPLAQESSVHQYTRLIAQLPLRAGLRVTNSRGEDTASPVVIRRFEGDFGSKFLVVNPSPVPLTVGCQFSASVASPPTVYPAEVSHSLQSTHGALWWTVQLQPYQACLAQFAQPGVQILQYQVTWPNGLGDRLAEHLQSLYNALARLRNPPLWPVLENPGFELASAPSHPLPGWLLLGPPGAAVRLDSAVKRSGTFSLHLVSPQSGATLVTHPFSPPQTGRLAARVHVHLGSRPNRVRLSLEGRSTSGAIFVLAETIAALPAAESLPSAENNFSFIDLEAPEIPSDELMAVRLRLDLLEPGELWVDDVLMTQLAFHRVELVELMKQIAPAETQLRQGRYADYLRLLENPWTRFLQSQTPYELPAGQDRPPASVAAQPAPAGSTESSASSGPTNPLDRIREWLPRRLRFF
jgi:hypothetical protein